MWSNGNSIHAMTKRHVEEISQSLASFLKTDEWPYWFGIKIFFKLEHIEGY